MSLLLQKTAKTYSFWGLRLQTLACEFHLSLAPSENPGYALGHSNLLTFSLTACNALPLTIKIILTGKVVFLANYLKLTTKVLLTSLANPQTESIFRRLCQLMPRKLRLSILKHSLLPLETFSNWISTLNSVRHLNADWSNYTRSISIKADR